MKKRLTAALMCLCMALSAVSCGDNDPNSKAATETAPAASTPAVTTVKETTASVPSSTTDTETTPTDDAKPEEPVTETIKAELEYWTEDSSVKKSIEEYVAMVTDPDSDKFIPEEDRIVTFDLDGTLMGELYPCYFDWCMFVYRALHDDTYDNSTEEMEEFAKTLEDSFPSRRLPANSELPAARYTAQAFGGMTIDEFRAYTKEYMKTPAEGFTNLNKGDAFYKPMVSLFAYLQANGFRCFVVSGTERNCIRELIKGKLDIPDDMVLGTDWRYVGTEQGETDGFEYVFHPGEEVIFSGELVTKDVKGNKVPIICREIGKVPVLAFGNSSGDISMCQYTVDNKKYESRAYMLLCDDLEREYGKPDVAEKLAETCEERGFITVSMKNDFATIYGDNVKLDKAEEPSGSQKITDNSAKEKEPEEKAA